MMIMIISSKSKVQCIWFGFSGWMKSVKSSIFLVDGMRMRKGRKGNAENKSSSSSCFLLGENKRMEGEKKRKGKEVGRFVGKLFSQSLSEEKSLLS